MARTREEIADAIKSEFMSNATLRSMYGFSETDLFDDKFSVISIERILIYIFTSAVLLIESIFDAFSTDITTRISNAVVLSIPWYHDKALSFQYGDNIIFDSSAYTFGYATVDVTKQIVKYVAVRQVVDGGVTKLKIYYSGVGKLALTTDQKAAFEAYITEIAAAGTHLLFVSQNPDALGVVANIYYDPLILNSSGVRISDNTKPVELAISNYLDEIKYGGVFYASSLIDAIQAVGGVKDVRLTSTYWNATSDINRRKIEAVSGAFLLDSAHTTLTYLLDE